MEQQASRLQVVGRWVALIPAAIAAGVIASLAVRQGNTALVGTYVGSGWLSRAYIELMSGGSLGVAFVLAGYAVAPVKHRWVAMSLGALVLVVAGAAVVIAFANSRWWQIFTWSCVIAGALLAASTKIDRSGNSLS